MRKSALLFAVLLAASLTTMADAATKKKAAAPKPDPAVEATDNSMRFIRDMFCPFCMQQAVPAKGKKA